VAELVTLGLTNREIANVLHVEEDTVKKHVSRAIAKVGVRNRTSLAVAWATGKRMDIRPDVAA
jgi:DNA-binding NarL/FixJ family response regulator